jgi:hypothetical protein
MIAVIPDDPNLSIVLNGSLTVLAAFLYALLAESQAPGSVRHPRFRKGLAGRAAFLTAMVALVPMVVFRLVEVKISDLSGHDLYVVAFLLWGVFVVPWLEMWMGLTVAVWLRRRGSRL